MSASRIFWVWCSRSSRRLHVSLLGPLLVAGALPLEPATLPAIRAALPPAVETNFTLEGKITKLSPGKLTLSSEGNIIFRVRYDAKTEIQRADGSKGSDKDFRVGVKVKVDGDLTESGEVVAARIAIE